MSDDHPTYCTYYLCMGLLMKNAEARFRTSTVVLRASLQSQLPYYEAAQLVQSKKTILKKESGYILCVLIFEPKIFLKVFIVKSISFSASNIVSYLLILSNQGLSAGCD